MIAPNSAPMHDDGFNHFMIPPTNASIEKMCWVNYRPTAPLSAGGPVNFHISGNGMQYTDLKSSKLSLKLHLEKEDGSAWVAADKVALINQPLHSLWSDVNVKLQQQDICSGISGTYAYKAYIENLMMMNQEELDSMGSSQMYYYDAVEHMNAIGDANAGFYVRSLATKNGKTLDVEGALLHDVFKQEKYILPGIDIQVELIPNRSNFILMHAANKKYRCVVTEAMLSVCRIQVAPEVMLAEMNFLKDDTAKYVFKNTCIKSFTVPKGNNSVFLDDLFQSDLPTHLVVGMVDADAFAGKSTKNPFEFKHNNINFAACMVDGQSVPSEPLKPNFNTDCYISAYNALMKTFDLKGWNQTRYDYKDGYTLIGFKVDPVATMDYKHLPLIKKGNLQLELKFGEALPNAINIIIYACFPYKFEIDVARNVIVG